ncbi:hypothetical protein [Gracilimonas sp.]|uniref:hypothetical protein n=1 Tax=Gracilimonas sp. TaxID=1974203 RepID=UPI003D0C4670
MKQFTSKINFKFTSKRLRMMGKQISRTRSNSIKILIAPVLLGLSLMFCTQQNTDNGLKAIEFRSGFGSIYYKSNPILYFKEEEKISNPPYYSFDPILYNDEGEVFTGTRTFYNRMTKEPVWEDYIQDGIMTKTMYLNQEQIDSTDIAYEIYGYDDGQYVTETRYNSNDELMARHEYTENSTRRYTPNGQLTFHGYTEIKDGIKWSYAKSWDETGQLRMDSKSGRDSSGFQQHMTLYDEEGNIADQIRIEDGELIKESK